MKYFNILVLLIIGSLLFSQTSVSAKKTSKKRKMINKQTADNEVKPGKSKKRFSKNKKRKEIKKQNVDKKDTIQRLNSQHEQAKQELNDLFNAKIREYSSKMEREMANVDGRKNKSAIKKKYKNKIKVEKKQLKFDLKQLKSDFKNRRDLIKNS